jgi:hypothetical protein
MEIDFVAVFFNSFWEELDKRRRNDIQKAEKNAVYESCHNTGENRNAVR